MDIEITGNQLKFSGFLNEKTDFSALHEAFDKALASSTDGRVVVDFSPIASANSIGILGFVTFLDAHEYRLTYRRVPPWLVEQLGMLNEFFLHDVIIESIVAPFYCPQTDENCSMQLEIGKDVPIQESYRSFRRAVEIDGKAYEPDFEPESFFLFISAHIELFRKQTGSGGK